MGKIIKEPTVEEKESVPVNEPEQQTQVLRKEKTDSSSGIKIFPKKKLQAFGKLDPSQQKQRDHDWEYVKGVFENNEMIGEAIEFWFCKYPGDPDCLWRIPANVPVWIPRMVAKHLEETMQFHKFDFIDEGKEPEHGEFVEEFKVISTEYRGKFRAIGAFD